MRPDSCDCKYLPDKAEAEVVKLKAKYIETRLQDCKAKQAATKTDAPKPWHCRFNCYSDNKATKSCDLRVVMDTNDLCRSIGCNSPDCIASARLRCMTKETTKGDKACGSGQMQKNGEISGDGSAKPIVEEYSEASKDGQRDPSIISSRVAVKEDWWKKQFDTMKGVMMPQIRSFICIQTDIAIPGIIFQVKEKEKQRDKKRGVYACVYH